MRTSLLSLRDAVQFDGPVGLGEFVRLFSSESRILSLLIPCKGKVSWQVSTYPSLPQACEDDIGISIRNADM